MRGSERAGQSKVKTNPTAPVGSKIWKTLDVVYSSSDTSSEEGCVYCVEGDKTSSGKPYVGRSDNFPQRQRDSSDGRDRTDAEIVDTYPKGDRDAGRAAEQKAINDRGGVGQLDNRRNEIAPRNWPSYGISR